MRKNIYKAYIAGTPESVAFDHAYGKTPGAAIGAVKRKNTPDWHDCVIWVVWVDGDGQEDRFFRPVYV